MDLGLTNKTTLVLGGGGAIAQSLAREGAAVAVANIAHDVVEQCVRAIEAARGRGISLTWDIGDLS